MAAISVTYFHLSNNSGLSKNIASSGQYGFLGVEVFFVISGFIIPYSMHKRDYQISDFFIFMGKRILRIYPPYLFILLIAVILMMVTFRPLPKVYIFASHLLYLNGILNYNWISPVFWTLAIEFQFYLFIALFYGTIVSKNHMGLILIMSAIFISSLFLPTSLLPHWFGMFALGMTTFRKIKLNMNAAYFWINISFIVMFTIYNNGLIEALACLVTIFFILFSPVEKETFLIRIGLWFGSISYSLYLIHWDFGRIAVSIFKHVPFIGGIEYLSLLFGFVFSILIAWLFYHIVEKPSITLSKKLRYLDPD